MEVIEHTIFVHVYMAQRRADDDAMAELEWAKVDGFE